MGVTIFKSNDALFNEGRKFLDLTKNMEERSVESPMNPHIYMYIHNSLSLGNIC